MNTQTAQDHLVSIQEQIEANDIRRDQLETAFCQAMDEWRAGRRLVTRLSDWNEACERKGVA